MNPIIQILFTECVPRQNCLLSITNQNGETGFLYFKEGQLIEANYGAAWGNDAMGAILTWQLHQYEISELPMGIKRTLWDPLGDIVRNVLGEVEIPDVPAQPLIAATPSSHAASHSAQAGQVEVLQLSGLKGCLALHEITGDGISQLYSAVESGLDSPSIAQILENAKLLGQSLGAGKLVCFYFHNESHQGWLTSFKLRSLLIEATHEVDRMTFENSIREILKSS